MKLKLLKLIVMASKLSLYGFIIQCIIFSSLLAADGNAQQIKSIRNVYIELDLQNAGIMEAFQRIEDQTDFKFAFDNKDLKNKIRVNFSAEKLTVAEALLKISEHANLKFRQVNNYINVNKLEINEKEPVEITIQIRTVTGKVTSGEDGEGLPGVNVVIKGTSQGTVTDVEGNYSLDIPDKETVLVFSSVGFNTEEIIVGNSSVIDLTMVPDITALEEIVVIGYGTRSKRDVTTSISNIESKEITQSIAMTSEIAMQGRMSGVQVSGNDGNPLSRPTIRIRGVNTWGVSNPLYVIDGIPIIELGSGIEGAEDPRVRDVRGPLNIMTLIDPNDIESISVLKDASAAAIYGVRAANGVILITTKKGRGDKPTVEFSGKFGIQNVKQNIDVLNTAQYTKHVQDVFASDPTITIAPENEGLFDPNDPRYLGNSPTYDWQSALRNENAPIQDYSVRISGGTDKTDYYVSAGYSSTEGTMIGNSLERLSGSFKLNTQVNRWLRTGINYRIASASGQQIWNLNYWESAQTPPWQPIYDENGPGGYAPVVPGLGEDGVYRSDKLYGTGTRFNFPGSNEFQDADYKSLRNMGTGFVELEPISGLKIKGSISFDTYNHTRYEFYDFRGSVFEYTRGDPRAYGGGNSVGTYGERDTYNNNLVKELTVNYQKSFNDHNLDFLASVMDQQYDSKYKAAGTEYMTTTKDYLRKIGGEAEYTTAESDIYRWALVGQLARIGYNYQSKYYIDATIRRDGSARFAPENRWGLFPSFSAAYRITNEEFFSSNWINDLKIRGGWGKLGNQEVRDMAYLSPIDTRPSYAFGNGNNGYGYFNTGAAVFGMANMDLLWEETATANIGFDALILDNLNFSFEYYDKWTDGLIQEVSLPTSVGVVDQPVANIGSVRNNGIELSLSYSGSINDFTFNVGGNFTTVNNTVEKMYEGIPQWNIEEGYPLYYIRGYKLGGTFQTREEIDKWLETYTDESYQLAKIAPGDFYYQDVRSAPGDGEEFYSNTQDSIINHFDQVYLGKTIPGFFYGFNLGMQYKGFDFSAQFTGVGDVQKYNSVKAAMEYTPGAGNNLSVDILDSWSESNKTSSRPRVVGGDPANNFRGSDYFVESGAYLRASYMQVGYTFPELKGAGISNLRVYFGASNLFTITPYTGLDPENDNYPTPQTFFTGLNVRF